MQRTAPPACGPEPIRFARFGVGVQRERLPLGALCPRERLVSADNKRLVW
jgi:hypothetical protein